MNDKEVTRKILVGESKEIKEQEKLDRDQVVDRLLDIKWEIEILLNEAESLVQETDESAYEYARSYWLPHIRKMLEGDPGSMQATINQIEADDEEAEEEDEG